MTYLGGLLLLLLLAITDDLAIGDSGSVASSGGITRSSGLLGLLSVPGGPSGIATLLDLGAVLLGLFLVAGLIELDGTAVQL